VAQPRPRPPAGLRGRELRYLGRRRPLRPLMDDRHRRRPPRSRAGAGRPGRERGRAQVRAGRPGRAADVAGRERHGHLRRFASGGRALRHPHRGRRHHRDLRARRADAHRPWHGGRGAAASLESTGRMVGRRERRAGRGRGGAARAQSVSARAQVRDRRGSERRRALLRRHLRRPRPGDAEVRRRFRYRLRHPRPRRAARRWCLDRRFVDGRGGG
jgi:hypothetical protein